MRTQLRATDLGDLLEQPLNALVATSLSNGEIMLTPYWHEWRDGGFNLFTLADGLKHRLMERNPHISITIAENGGIRRGIEVRGIACFSYDDVNEMCGRIAQRYMPSERVIPFLRALERVSMVHVRIEPGKLRAWDSADGIPGWDTELARRES
jgi:hypothetical protein